MNEKEKALKTAQAEPPITKQALLTEVAAAIRDLFIAEVTEENGGLHLQFFNGQRFEIGVTEL